MAPIRNNTKLTASEVRDIRRLALAGTPVTTLAARFGVTPMNIRCIVWRRTWVDIPDDDA
jgi:hypothetical protein